LWLSIDAVAPEGQLQFDTQQIAQTQPTLVQYGSMHETIGMQQHQGRVSLGELLKRPHFYGVGALEKLQGEISIIDSRAIISTVAPTGSPKVVSENAHELQATLLVGAEVPQWTNVEIPKELTGEALDAWIQRQAEQHGLDTRKSFPFMIEGEVTDLRYHIIHGACPVHAKRNDIALHDNCKPFVKELSSIHAKIVGVFALHAAGKITHPGTSMHAHIVYMDEQKRETTGHLEQFTVGSDAKLMLPK
jgi:alpha-acetolactate decarboxylase